MKPTKTPEDYYNNRDCERPAIVIILVAAFIILFSCEPLEVGGPGCCWTCRTRTTYYYPKQQPSEVSLTLKFEDMFCDCPYEKVLEWEEHNTWSDTINKVWTVQIAACKQ